MSNTVAEAVPATQPAVQTPAAVDTTAEPATQNKRFSNVQKTVGSKAKAFLDAFHTAGEHIRGNINAALDGAGDAIAGRKAGKVTGRKSGEQASRTIEPTVPATTEPAVAIAATAPAAAETNATGEATAAQQPDEKKFVVGQFINTSFKRTATLVHRVGGSLRSKSTSTVDSLGNTLSNGKQRASRRFSRAPKVADGTVVEESSATATPVPAEAPLAAAPAAATTA
ncbi:hypothetical protein PTTG_04583 [Puccinia triticina 1-1 BBBD Race 1]|uniref:Uncharacterized protein n=2 Tax=Puccinia triticina TaxID=208348 RepID=A0A0C4EUV2_PUCT1|nr:uncharacterized protein PtA15_8A603 [Puccinia triticina]OAV99335.1 hypothetical protein PTTG_04583 [Puccinia triticina 1-1 BBBD Race 1]WAQ87697.1 hypothetical protein PtA15_8A603 [Puccinia triticina]WAR57577.1 hypothetical protein PtB15_8B629 [Puccinia triticina]